MEILATYLNLGDGYVFVGLLGRRYESNGFGEPGLDACEGFFIEGTGDENECRGGRVHDRGLRGRVAEVDGADEGPGLVVFGVDIPKLPGGRGECK